MTVAQTTPLSESLEALRADAPGALGALLRDAGLRARVVIERDDGTSLTEADRTFVADVLDGFAVRDAMAERSLPLNGFVAGRHFGHLLPKLAHTGQAAKSKPTKPKAKRAAAKRPSR